MATLYYVYNLLDYVIFFMLIIYFINNDEIIATHLMPLPKPPIL